MDSIENVKLVNSIQIQCCTKCLIPFSSSNIWRTLPCLHQICEKCILPAASNSIKCVKCGNVFQYTMEHCGFIITKDNTIRIFDESDMLINGLTDEDININNISKDMKLWAINFQGLMTSLQNSTLKLSQEKIKGPAFIRQFPIKQSTQGTILLENKMLMRLHQISKFLNIRFKSDEILLNKHRRASLIGAIGQYELYFGNNIDAAIVFLEYLCTELKINKSWWNMEYESKLDACIFNYDFRWEPKLIKKYNSDMRKPKLYKYISCSICSPSDACIICDSIDNLTPAIYKKIATHKCLDNGIYYCFAHSLIWKLNHLKDDMKCILNEFEMSKVASEYPECKKYVISLIQIQYSKHMNEGE